jgi:membrane protein implicated in regulation of membrane protease activity
MNMLVCWALVGIGAAMILLEILLGAVSGFDFLLMGSAILIGGAVGLLSGSGAAGMVTAGVLAILYVAFGRRRLRSRLRRPGIPSNTDALLGAEVLVIEETGCDQAGRVRHEGEEWRALIDARECPAAIPLARGAKARIRRIDGVTAFVVPLDGHDARKGDSR